MAVIDVDTLALRDAGQEHLLAHLDKLSGPAREGFARQLASLDVAWLGPAIARAIGASTADAMVPSELEPAEALRVAEGPERSRLVEAGETLIRAGKVAAFTVAGGQGTRLGFEGPKGCFPAGPVTGKTLFAIFAEGISATRRRYNCAVPWYIMTSPLNDAVTRAFFEEHDFFNLGRDNVRFLPQGTLPSFDARTGRILLAEPGVIATNPDGHGGAVTALHRSGALDEMRARGVEHVSYFQVDNPLVRVVDPLFLGAHAAGAGSSGEMTSKAVSKSHSGERVGVFCTGRFGAEGSSGLTGRRTCIVEYSDLPGALAEARDAAGGLRFSAGSIALHAMSVAFLRRLATEAGFELPLHKAVKKVPFIDPLTMARIEPADPNAVKLERFVFDAIPRCRSSLVVMTERAEEFAPIKNATGADSVASSRAMQSERAGAWLERAGVRVPRKADGALDCTLEISPLTALDWSDLRGRRVAIGPGDTLAL